MFNTALETANKISDLIVDNKDSIHPFILKNIYKPSSLGLFDVVIGNPPWLSYRYVRNPDRQKDLIDLIIKKYNLFSPIGGRTVSHMEHATLFFVMCSDIYLSDTGTIAFVMPRSIFNSEHHDEFRKGSYDPEIGISLLYDLEEVNPLFNIQACVVVGHKNKVTNYPVETLRVTGQLPSKNIRYSQLQKLITDGKVHLETGATNMLKVGGRSVWSSAQVINYKGIGIVKGQSPYMRKFIKGATLYPRQFWFVSIKPHKDFGIDVNEPYLETSERARQMGKLPYKNIAMKGSIESTYLFGTLLGSDILPFCNLPIRTLFLPVEMRRSSTVLVDPKLLSYLGHNGASEWMTRAEEHWSDKRKEKADKWNVYQLLDFRHQLTNQKSGFGYKVIFNASGTYLNSTVLTDKSNSDINGIKLNGLVMDDTTVYYDSPEPLEVYYLCAIFNSSVMNELIKPIQAHGLWGARHIHKKPLELPIKTFDNNNNLHRELSNKGKLAFEKASAGLPQLLQQMNVETDIISPNLVGRLRGKIRDILQKEISEIDNLTIELFKK